MKCQGIKTRLVPWIRSVVPDEFDGVWIEPFLGSGAVVFNIRPKRALLSDSNPHIVEFYRAVADRKITAQTVRVFLQEEGDNLLQSGGAHYYTVRDRFNEQFHPLDFLFLNRSCFNGLIRFNRKGKFNVPFCQKPARFSKSYITKIVNQVKAVENVMEQCDFRFFHSDFIQTIGMATEEDLVYCDPPYIGRHTDYFTEWNEMQERKLESALYLLSSKFILSTWHSNAFRTNEFIELFRSKYYIETRAHFYHIGAKERNRNAMLEALVMNFPPPRPASDGDSRCSRPNVAEIPISSPYR